MKSRPLTIREKEAAVPPGRSRDNVLTVLAGPSTDWFISPVDGKVGSNAPILLFQPADDFVLTAKVAVEFQTKWDAGALMLYVNDSTWAKFALEMSVYQEPTIVTAGKGGKATFSEITYSARTIKDIFTGE